MESIGVFNLLEFKFKLVDTLLIEALKADQYRLLVTSLVDPPWFVSCYYGIENGRYLEHLEQIGRRVDNDHSEGMNHRLEGYAPLIRLPPGQILSEQPKIRALLAG